MSSGKKMWVFFCQHGKYISRELATSNMLMHCIPGNFINKKKDQMDDEGSPLAHGAQTHMFLFLHIKSRAKKIKVSQVHFFFVHHRCSDEKASRSGERRTLEEGYKKNKIIHLHTHLASS
jgi:hypothetical protein